MRTAVATVCLLLVVAAATDADVDLDVQVVTRTHREHITRSPHAFVVEVNAEDLRPFSSRSVVDDIMQSVTIEGPAVNPRLRVEGMPDLHSLDALLGSILRPGMSDFEKALAIHTTVARFSVYTSSPSRRTWGMDDPIIAFNCGAGICGNFTVWTKVLAWRAGLPARTFEITHHTVPEIFYDGRWHMFDPTTRTFFIGRDNRAVADVRELEKNLALMKRAGAGKRNLSFYASADDNRLGGHLGGTGWRMDVNLRRGETLKRLTDKDGPSLWDYDISRRKLYATGFLNWTPDLARDDLKRVLSAHANLTRTADGLRPDKPGEATHATFRVASPYPLTRATLTGRFGKASAASTLRLLVTAHAPGMNTWTREVFVATKPGIAERTIDLTPQVFGAYSYDVRFEMRAAKAGEATGVRSIAFANVIQLNRYSLPHLTGGTNRIVYVDDAAARDVTVAYTWREQHPLTSDPFPPRNHRTNRLKVRVRNRGNEVARNVAVDVEQLWARKKFKKTAVIDRIDPGKTGVAEVDWRPSHGYPAWFRLTVDPKNVIAETDEKNNVFQRGIRVVSPPDVSVEPSQLTLERRGKRARLEALLINIGGLPARDVTVAFLAGDGKTGRVVGRTHVPVVYHARTFSTDQINPFAWATLDVDADALTGTHLGVRVDPDDTLDEHRRDNNVAWVALKDAARRRPPVEGAAPDPFVFFSFEPGKGELRDIETLGLVANQVTEHATDGRQSAKLTFPAGKTASLRFLHDAREARLPRRWDTFTRLRFDVFLDDDRGAALTLRAAALSTEKKRSHHDAVFALPPRKPVTVELPLGELSRVNLRAVESLELLMNAPPKKTTLFVDHFRFLREPNADRRDLAPIVRPRQLAPARTTAADPQRVARPITLDDKRDFDAFTRARYFVVADDFGAPDARRGAKVEIKRGRSIGLTLELTREASPWPADWSTYRRLTFDAKRASKQPFAVSVKLRSSHPERGVKYVSRSFALRPDGAQHFIDLDEIRGRLDLDCMTHVTWFVWRPQFEGTLWLGKLRLEK